MERRSVISAAGLAAVLCVLGMLGATLDAIGTAITATTERDVAVHNSWDVASITMLASTSTGTRPDMLEPRRPSPEDPETEPSAPPEATPGGAVPAPQDPLDGASQLDPPPGAEGDANATDVYGLLVETITTFDEPSSCARCDVELQRLDGAVVVQRASLPMRLVGHGPRLFADVLVFVASLLLFRALRRTFDGEPFAGDTSRLLTKLGVVLLAGLPALPLLDLASAVTVLSWAGAAPAGAGVLHFLDLGAVLSFTTVLPGLLVLTLVGVFRRGERLELEMREIV